MTTSIILAWMVGEGLMIYNNVAIGGHPPFPSDLLATSGLFVLLALMGERWPQLAALLAWGFDAAAFLTLFSNKASASKSKSAPKSAPKKG